MHSPRIAVAAAFLATASISLAQTPFVPLADMWVTDSSNDRVTRLRDLNFDGDYDDVGEAQIFYDDAIGPWPLSLNNYISSRADGSLWISEAGTDQILVMRDLNGDGDAHDANEAVEYFAALFNANGLLMPTPQGMAWQGSVLYVANSQAGSSGKDTILRFEDLNNDGDAMDAGESSEYYVSSDLSLGGAGGDSLPQDVQVGLDGALYYLDAGSTGVIPKGIYRLVDLDSSGAIDAPAEVTPFFIPTALGATPFYWNVEQDSAGYWYLADTGNDVIWRAFDANGDNVIDPVTEAVQWWVSPSSSLIWDVRVGADGLLYVGETQNNDRFFTMLDADSNDSIDPLTEVKTVYDQNLSLGDPIGQLRGWCFDAKQQAPSQIYCAAQVNTLGCSAAVSVAGWPSFSHGSGYLLTVSSLRNQKNGVLFYGLAGAASLPFNGGTLCVQPPTRRVAVFQSGGTAFGDDCSGSISFDFNAWIASGADVNIVLGSVLNAQYWSRDPGAAPANTNVSNAVEFCVLR